MDTMIISHDEFEALCKEARENGQDHVEIDGRRVYGAVCDDSGDLEINFVKPDWNDLFS